MDDTILTPAEVADYAKVSPSTVNRWAASGTLPTALQLPGGARRFRRTDVEALLAPKDTTQAVPA